MQWDYAVVEPQKVGKKDIESVLQRYGEQGWELAAVIPKSVGPSLLILKKPKNA